MAASTSQSDSNYCVEELANYSKNIIKMALNNCETKLPLKRSEMVNFAVDSKPKLFQRALDGARTFLNDCHGMDIVEVPECKSVKLYICVATTVAGSPHDYKERQKSEMVLLYLILSYIFMKGVPVSEKTLEIYLSKIKININEPHPFFGDDIKKRISDKYVKQLYLKRTKFTAVGNHDEEIFYSWGFRSTLEFPKEKVLSSVAELMSKPSSCFVRQQMEIDGVQDTA